MEKIAAHTPDLVQANIEAIAELFPEVITEALDAEGNVTRAIDFDALRQQLSDHVVEGPRERFFLDWPGKRAATLAANSPTRSTLRPMIEESVDFDTTKNVFIEGDNLEALKILQESYLGKVKLIYIDPPYNTGNDFIYDDDFSESVDEYLSRTGQTDDHGTRLVVNTESNGRFHSDWLSMMLSRIKIARSLLTDDGLFFMSIDQHEVANAMRLCSEVFGDSNFIGVVSVVNNLKGRSDDAFFATANEFLICCARSASNARIAGLEPSAEYLAEFQHVDEISRYKEVALRKTGKNSRREDRPNMHYPIYFSPTDSRFSLHAFPGSIEILPSDSEGKPGCWRWGKETFSQNCTTELVAREVGGRWSIYVKMRDIVDGKPRTIRPKSVWIDPKFDTGAGARAIKELFGVSDLFTNPKPVSFIAEILAIATDSDSLVMDFFAGSGTTAQAVMEANARDGGCRRWLLIQLPEAVSEGSSAYAMGFHTISALARERVAKAGEAQGLAAGLLSGPVDVGFRAFQVASSSYKDVLRTPDETLQTEIDLMSDNIAAEQGASDLLFHVLLDWGLELSLSLDREVLGGATVFNVDDDGLLACFEESLSTEVVKLIAQRKPLRAVFRDSSFNSDAERINVEQIFKELSPETQVKVI